jgi:hypothetical protein
MKITPGAIRFNIDSMKLEYYHLGSVGIGTLAAGEWVQLTTDSPEVQTGGTRGLLMGGYNPSNTYLDEIVYINVATTGNSLSFGELTVSDRNHVNMGVSDRTRAISAGGAKVGDVKTADIEYVTMASTGNAVDFGADLTGTRYGGGPVANSTRGVFMGGNPGSGAVGSDIIDYITIASTGVAAQDFGNLTQAIQYPAGSMCSSTRGIHAGGRIYPAYKSEVDYITISTQGNAGDFGNLDNARAHGTPGSITSNSIRGLVMGGYATPTYYNRIDHFTIATLGNGVDFGDLSAVRGSAMGASSPTRCVMMGGAQPGYVVTMEYVQIMTLGDSVDFGDIHTQVTAWGAGASNGHGGLG